MLALLFGLYYDVAEKKQSQTERSAFMAEEMKDFADGYYFMTPFNRAGMIAKILQKIRNGQEEQA